MNCRGCGHVYPISNGIPNMVSPSLIYGQSLIFSSSLSTRWAGRRHCRHVHYDVLI